MHDPLFRPKAQWTCPTNALSEAAGIGKTIGACSGRLTGTPVLFDTSVAHELERERRKDRVHEARSIGLSSAISHHPPARLLQELVDLDPC